MDSHRLVNGSLGSITRRVDFTQHVPDHDAMMHSPHYWLGTLAASIHGHLNQRQPAERLEHDYREFMGSPACSDELRAILEGP